MPSTHARAQALSLPPWRQCHLYPSVTGQKRALAGLADVAITAADLRATHQERAARTLVAILPLGCAAFVCKVSAEKIASRPAAETAERMVDILKHAGRTNLDGAYSTLGCLLTWATIEHPGAVIDGETVREWLNSIHVTQATMTSVTWLRDWTALQPRL